MRPSARRTSESRGEMPRAFSRTPGLLLGPLAIRGDELAQLSAPLHGVGDARALSMLGFLLLLGRRAEEGLGLIEEAARLEPADEDIWFQIGMARLAMKDVLGAEEAFKEAIRLDPVEDNALAAMGSVHLYRGEHDRAIDCYERAIRIAGAASAHLHSGLSRALGRAGRLEEARAALEKAAAGESRADFEFGIDGEGLRIRPGKSLPSHELDLLARALAIEGRFAEAKARFTESIRIAPGSIRARAGLARIHHRLGELCEALDALTELLRLCESIDALVDLIPWAQSEMAVCLIDLGRREEALDLYRSALDDRVRWSPLEVSSVEETIRALESAGPATEAHRIPSVRISECAREDHCMSLALGAVLGHWKFSTDVDGLARELSVQGKGADPNRVTNYVEGLNGWRAIWFTATPMLLKELSRRGFPSILIHEILDEGDYGGHASVVAGFDDSQGAFLLEDSNWFSGLDRISYSRVEGECAFLAVPTDRLDAVSESLPGREHWAAVFNAAAAEERGDRDATRSFLEEAVRLDPQGFTAQRRLVRLRPLDARAHALLGLIQHDRGEIELSEQAYLDAHGIAPKFRAPIQNLLEIAINHRGDSRAALAWCDAVLEISRGMGSSTTSRGRSWSGSRITRPPCSPFGSRRACTAPRKPTGIWATTTVIDETAVALDFLDGSVRVLRGSGALLHRPRGIPIPAACAPDTLSLSALDQQP